MFDIGLGQIEGNKDYNFSKKYDEDNEKFSQNMNSCKYYEIEEISKIFSNKSDNFSIYSHNIRSLNGHWDDILDIVYSANPVKFSVLAFQEIWSVPKTFSIPGYGKLEYSTRDKNGPLNPNCGGGVGFLGAKAPLGLAMGVTVTVSVTKKFLNCRISLELFISGIYLP